MRRVLLLLAACGQGAPPPAPAAARASAASAPAPAPSPSPAPSPPPPAAASPVERIDADRVRVGAVCVDLAARALEAPGFVNMAQGILEYVAVGEGGKRHESLLWLDVRPVHLQIGLTLLDLAPGHDRVRLHVRHGARTRPIGDWVRDREGKAAMPAAPWAFTGSQVQGGALVADHAQSLAAVWPDPTAILNTTLARGNPYRGPALGFEVFAERVPPVGTPVALVAVADGKAPPRRPICAARRMR